jgi:hypothetical protein
MENYDFDMEQNNETGPNFEDKSEARKYLRLLLDAILEDAHDPDILVTARSAGTIEGILLGGLGCGAITSEDFDEYQDRLDAINKMKEEGVLPLRPCLFIPNNAIGKRYLRSLQKKMVSHSFEELENSMLG